MRKTLKRNLSYDDRNHLYYVSLYYDGENGRRVRRTRTYPTMEQAEQVIPVMSNCSFCKNYPFFLFGYCASTLPP